MSTPTQVRITPKVPSLDAGNHRRITPHVAGPRKRKRGTLPVKKDDDSLRHASPNLKGFTGTWFNPDPPKCCATMDWRKPNPTRGSRALPFGPISPATPARASKLPGQQPRKPRRKQLQAALGMANHLGGTSLSALPLVKIKTYRHLLFGEKQKDSREYAWVPQWHLQG